MTNVYQLDQIKKGLENIDVLAAIEDGFIFYSRGETVIPPVGELIFENPPGDAHIKYGYIKNDAYYVIKIASGFYENIELGISPANGVMLLFSRQTGELVSILLDEGYLTNIRTAAAGAIAAKYLAPQRVERIGVFGAGIQGQLQVKYLQSIVPCKDVMVWGVNQKELDDYQGLMEADGYHVVTTTEPGAIADSCNLIVTATPTRTPLLGLDQIRKGTHITAVGADTPEKNELDPHIIQHADIVVADSIEQCLMRGEIHQAMRQNLINRNNVIELGAVAMQPSLARTSDEQITIADLTGVAVQDIQIAKKIHEVLNGPDKARI